MRQLTGCPMSANGSSGADLTEALRAETENKMRNRNATWLNVDFGDAGAVFVAEILRGNTVVESLRLLNSGIGAVGARSLGDSLAEDNATLKSLLLQEK